MKVNPLKRRLLLVLLAGILLLLSACARSKMNSAVIDDEPRGSTSFIRNHKEGKIASYKGLLYTVVGDELLQFDPVTKQTKAVLDLSKAGTPPVEDFMLFEGDGRLWLLAGGYLLGDQADSIQLVAFKEDLSTLEKPVYRLDHWPTAAGLVGRNFFFTQQTEQTGDQIALYKLDVSTGRLTVVNNGTVLDFTGGPQTLYYAANFIKKDPVRKMGVPSREGAEAYIYNIDEEVEEKIGMSVAFPCFSHLGDRYVTLSETGQRAENCVLELRDKKGAIKQTYPFGNGLGWPDFLSTGQKLVLLARSEAGDRLLLLDEELEQVGEWQLAAGAESSLQAMDERYLYFSQVVIKADRGRLGEAKEGDLSAGIAEAYYRLDYTDKDSTPEAIFTKD